MQDYGLVSIITPSYNCANFIAQTIESIIAQTYQNWELLITDDCSTDSSYEVIKRFADVEPRIKLFRLETNGGAGASRNYSLNKAQGRFIAFCDSDDYWCSDKLEKQLAFMRQNHYFICYSSYFVVDENNNTIGKVFCPKHITHKDIMHDDSMGMLTLIYDTEAADKQEFPLIRRRQDWAMKILLMRQIHDAYGIGEPLAYYRHTKNSLSRNKFALVKYNMAVYEEVLGFSWLRARYHFYCRFMPKYINKKVVKKIFLALKKKD